MLKLTNKYKRVEWKCDITTYILTYVGRVNMKEGKV